MQRKGGVKAKVWAEEKRKKREKGSGSSKKSVRLVADVMVKSITQSL